MADVQLENGYTRIANLILEALAKMPLNGTQWRILLVVFRYTYGFGRKDHAFSLGFLSKSTNLNKQQIKRELDDLISKNIICVVSEASFRSSRVIGFNKDFDQWAVDSKRIRVQSTNKNTVSEIETSTVSELAYPTVSGLEYQERKYKENNKESSAKILINDFKSVFEYYLTLNLIKHRTYTKDMQKAINKAAKDNKYTIEYCKTLLDRHKQVVEKTKSSSYPVRIRGFAEFFGQKVYGATYLICSEYEEGGKYYEQYINQEVENKSMGNNAISMYPDL